MEREIRRRNKIGLIYIVNNEGIGSNVMEISICWINNEREIEENVTSQLSNWNTSFWFKYSINSSNLANLNDISNDIFVSMWEKRDTWYLYTYNF